MRARKMMENLVFWCGAVATRKLEQRIVNWLAILVSWPSDLSIRQIDQESEIRQPKERHRLTVADGHTASNTPDLFRPPKLSGAGPG